MKINNFRGDLTDISAKKEALIVNLVTSAHLTMPGQCFEPGSPRFALVEVQLYPFRHVADQRRCIHILRSQCAYVHDVSNVACG